MTHSIVGIKPGEHPLGILLSRYKSYMILTEYIFFVTFFSAENNLRTKLYQQSNVSLNPLVTL